MLIANIKSVLRRRFSWLIIAVVVLPLSVILAVQVSFLQMINERAPVYRRQVLSEFLNAVTSGVRDFYFANAEAVLSVPAESFGHYAAGVVEDDAERTRSLAAVGPAAEHFGRNQFAAASHLFVFVATRFEGGERSEVFFYDPARRSMERGPQSREVDAVWGACAHQLTDIRARAPGRPTLVAYYTNMETMLLFKLVVDGEGRGVAVVGLIVDAEQLRHEVVPRVVNGLLPRFFPAEGAEAQVALRNGRGWESLLRRGTAAADPEMSARFPGFLGHYEVGVTPAHLEGERWAEYNYRLSLALSLTMALLLLGGVFLGLRGASREVRLSQMKTELIANVSHELRTPLSSIRVLAEMLKYGRVRDWERVRAYGGYIDEQGRRLTQLVNNILDFSRIESGGKAYRFERTDIRAVADEALAAVAGRVAQTGHLIRFESDGVPPPVNVDRDALTFALTNLIDNAIKYSAPGTEITLRLVVTADALLVTVSDRGIGIPRAEQQKVFEKFYRVSTGMVHNVKGSGLGLAIVKHIVEAHGGRISLESEPGRGSAFTISLPRGAGDADGAGPMNEEEA